MPKALPQTQIHNGNGHAILPAPGGNRLSDRLRQQLHSDHVEIGSPLYVPGEEDETGSFADMAGRVAELQWLARGWVAHRMLTGLIGHSKAGKSLWAMWCLVRSVITGCNWFNGLPGPEPGYAIWCDTERRAVINLGRAQNWGLPMDRIKTPFKDPLRPLNIDNQDEVDRVKAVVCRYRAPLVVVDSFRGAHRGDENSSRIVGPLDRLASIAEETGAAVVLIHHTGKPSLDGAEINMHSARGSSAFLAAVAMQIAIDQPDPKNQSVRRFQVKGENLGAAPEPQGFIISRKGLAITTAPAKEYRPTQRDKARDWLTGRMQPGTWYLAKTLLYEAKQFSLSGNALQRAREELGITLETGLLRQNAEGKYEWRLP